jgi:hypothetical protein
MQLQYGSLEGPENGVYIRGRLMENDTIMFPDYWTALVDSSTITVNLTPIGKAGIYFVEYVTDEFVKISCNIGKIDCYYTVFAERKDVPRLTVEY